MKHLRALILPTVFSSAGYPADDPWAPLQFLVGDWKGDGNAEGSWGSGITSFRWELGHQVLVRRDATTYEAGAEKPAFTYEALMVIYKSPTSNGIEANYYDSGNHVVSYRLSPDSVSGSARFVSHGFSG